MLPWRETPSHLMAIFSSGETGLAAEAVLKKRQVFGPNEIETRKAPPFILEFLSKFVDPLILILLFASLISALLGQITNFVIISVMVFMSVVLDYYQERQAKNAAAKLRDKVGLTATVIRHEGKIEIPALDLVPGDILLLSAGGIVPADARLVESRNLLVNQNALTGESFPQEKNDHLLKSENLEVNQIDNMVFMGTSILHGEARAIVVATGKATQIGKIAKDLSQKRPPTEFEVGARHFGLFLMRLTLILVIFVFAINALFRHDVLESFLFALALAVGLTPELLPIVITINLSRGATRMASKGVIVKSLPAIQNFGGIQVLATDKTGTITQDKIRLEKYENIFSKEDKKVLLYGFLNGYFQSGIKSPLETAVLAHREVSTANFTKVDEVPFDFTRKRLSVIVKGKKGPVLITKGAPEGIFALCHRYYYSAKSHPLTADIQAKILAEFKNLSRHGFRVLAVAYKRVGHKDRYKIEDEKNLTLLGLMSFLDPPKEDASDAVRILEKHGIEMKIFTGDNELVTRKICDEIKLPVKGVIIGKELESLNNDQLFDVARKNTVFARLNPDQKERLILSLKSHNISVGFLGDGINDAPSLRAADVGISVNNAVAVAKEAADMILLRKDLHVLKEGIIEGRKTFANVMKYIMMGTSSNFGNMASVALASLFLPFLPMLPVQILLNNFLYDVSQIFLSGDRVDPEAVIKPVKWDVSFIKKFTFIFGPISSIFDFLTFALLYYVFRASMPLFHTGWFIESLVTQTLIIFSIRTRVQPFYHSRPGPALIISSAAIIIIGLALPLIAPLAQIFGFVRPPIVFYPVLLAFVLGYFTLVERTKCWFYTRH